MNSASGIEVAPTGLGQAVEIATLRLLRASSAFGFACAVVVLVSTLASMNVANVSVASGWTIAWAIAVFRPQWLWALLDRQLIWFISVIAAVSCATVSATGGIDSPTIIDANWIVWSVAVLASWRGTLACAAAIAFSHALAFSLSGFIPSSSSQGDLYFAVTQLLNPIVVAAVALALVGVFRRTLGASATVGSQWHETRSKFVAPKQLEERSTDIGDSAPMVTERPSLTPSEREIVDALATGLTPQQIAIGSHRSVATVYDHIANAKRRFGARTTAHLISLAWTPS